MKALVNEMLDLPVWAVIGATQTENKFGYRIWKRLKDRNYEIYGVNPNYTTINGEVCYPDLKSLPQKPDCISMVIPPDKAKPFIEEAAAMGINKIWFQPGTFDQELIEFTESLNIQVVCYHCVLVELDTKMIK